MGIFAIAALICFLLYRPPVLELQTSLTTIEKLRRVSIYCFLSVKVTDLDPQLDWLGYGITMFAVIGFSIGLSWAQNPCTLEYIQAYKIADDARSLEQRPRSSTVPRRRCLVRLAGTVLLKVEKRELHSTCSIFVSAIDITNPLETVGPDSWKDATGT